MFTVIFVLQLNRKAKVTYRITAKTAVFRLAGSL